MIVKAKKIFTMYMVLTILVSSNTFAYYEHICLLTKVKSLSFEPKTCVSPSGKKTTEDFVPHFQKKTCCDLNLVVKKIDQSGFHNFNFDSSSINFFGFLLIPSVVFNISPVYLLIQTLGYANTSPPFFIDKIYILISVIRI